MTAEDRVTNILSEVLLVDLTPELKELLWEDIGLDEDIAEITMLLEETYSIEIDKEDIFLITTVQSVIDLFVHKLDPDGETDHSSF